MNELILTWIESTDNNNNHVVKVSIPDIINFTTIINIKNINTIKYFVNRLIMFDCAYKNLQLVDVNNNINSSVIFTYLNNSLMCYVNNKYYYIHKSSAIVEFKSLLKNINANPIINTTIDSKMDATNVDSKMDANVDAKMYQNETIIKFPDELNI